MKLTVLEDCAAIASQVADDLARLAASSQARVVLLPAGRTPLALYAELRERLRRGRLDLRQVHAFQLDELAGVAPDDARGFHAFLERELLDPIAHPRSRRHLIDGSSVDARAEIERHARELAARGGADLALLGLGQNGHVAFNEPGSELTQAARVVELAELTRSGLANVLEQVPTQGLTLGLMEISAAARVCMIVTGESKRSILAELLDTLPSDALPASFVHEHADALVLADRAAVPGQSAAQTLKLHPGVDPDPPQ